MLFDQVPRGILEAIFETTGAKSKVSAQKAIQNMFEFLKKEGMIGAAAMASGTYEGIISNFKDLPLVFARAIGGMPGEGGFYDQIKTGLARLFMSIASELKGDELVWCSGEPGSAAGPVKFETKGTTNVMIRMKREVGKK